MIYFGLEIQITQNRIEKRVLTFLFKFISNRQHQM